MKPEKRSKKYGNIRRISITVLLFTFCSITLLSQELDSIAAMPADVTLPVEKPAIEKSDLDSRKQGVRPQGRRLPEPEGRISEPADELEQAPLMLLDDTISQSGILADTTAKEELEEGHSARKALIYSIVCPGLGQAYNKKYWKMPIVYAALGGAGYAIYYNTREYRNALDEYEIAYLQSSTQADDRYVKYWRRNMELSYIAVVALDALAVVDAYVDANLFYWDVDPDLTLRVEPAIQPVFNGAGSVRNNYGFKCSLTF